jgi:hypothetical protein
LWQSTNTTFVVREFANKISVARSSKVKPANYFVCHIVFSGIVAVVAEFVETLCAGEFVG